VNTFVWVGKIMKLIIRKTIILLFFSIFYSLLLLSIVFAADFSLPKLNDNGLFQDASFSINNLSQVSQPVLYVKKFNDFYWNQISLSYSNSKLQGVIPSSLLDSEGVYLYYVQDASKRFPDGFGFKKFILSDKEPVYLSKFNSLIQSEQDSSSYSCKPLTVSQNYLSCFWSNMNAAESLRFAQAYKLSSNESYKNLSLDLAFSKFNNDSFYKNDSRICDAYQKDFNCSSFSPGAGVYFSGAIRQGEDINFFNQVANILNNDSVLNISENYALGSAQECDVWSGDFNCSCIVTNNNCVDEDNQGAMILAYWNIYESTGNQTYKNIAKNLTSQGLSFSASPILLQAFSKAYEMTGDSVYESKINSLANQLLGLCKSSSCDSLKRSEYFVAFLEAYKQTNSFIYKQEATKILLLKDSSSCNPFLGDYSCDDSLEQGEVSSSFFYAYNNLPDKKKIFGISYNTTPLINTALPLNFFIDGFQENLTLHYRFSVDTWNELNFSYSNDSIIIPSSYLNTPGYYEYYVTSSSSRFPVNNASISFILPISFDAIKSYFQGLLNNDSSSSCDPHQTNINLDDFSCQRENFQGWSGNGFYESLFALNSSQSSLRNYLISTIEKLSSAYIDLDSGYDVQSSCEHLDNDFVCNYRSSGDFSDPLQERGAIRQALMIILELDAYQLTNNQTFLNTAIKYLESRNDDCNPFNGDYSCMKETIGHLSYAYYKAFYLTGNNFFLDIANNLSNKILLQTSNDYTEMAGIALWYAYDLTGNTLYLSKAKNISDYYLDDCIISNSCSASKLGLNSLLMWEGVRVSNGNESSYLNKAVLNAQYGVPKYSGQYCNPTSNKFSCETPQDQGILLASYAKSMSSLVDFGNTSYQINISLPSDVNYSDEFPVTCSVKNLNHTSGFDLFLISTFDIVSASSDVGVVDSSLKKITFPSSSSGVINNASWVLNASWGLPTSVRCAVLNFQNSSLVTVNNIYDILSFSHNDSFFLRNNHSSIFDIKLNNIVDFDLKNLTTSISLLYQNLTPVNNSFIVLESLNSSKSSTELNNSTIMISDVFVGESIYLYLNISGIILGDYVLKLETNTSYGGYDSILIPLHVYEPSPFLINTSIPKILSVNDVVNITANVTFLRNFSLKNFSISLNNTNLTIKSFGVNSSSIFTNVSSHTFFTDNLMPLDVMTFYWEVYPETVGDYNVSILANSFYPVVGFETNTSLIRVNGEVFNSIISLSPNVSIFENGDQFVLSLEFFQSSEQNLTNVTASLNNFSGLDILSLSTDFLDLISENYSLYLARNKSLVNVTDVIKHKDSIFLNESNSSLQLNFSLSGHNQSYNFTSINISLYAKLLGNASISIINGSLQQKICSFSNNDFIFKNYSCTIPSSLVLSSDSYVFALFNSSSNYSIDSFILQTSSQKNITTGKTTSLFQSNYDLLKPSSIVSSTWRFKLFSSSDVSLNVDIKSDQGASKSYSLFLSKNSTTSSSSGGSGGGSFFLDTETVYSYDNYDFCNETKDFPEIYALISYNKTCSSNNHSIITNTLNVVSCINVSRNFYNDSTNLLISVPCLKNNTIIYVLDNISKDIFNSTDNFSIYTSINKKILNSDPLLLFSSKSKKFEISYYSINSSNRLSDFSRPIIFVINSTPNIMNNNSSIISNTSEIITKDDNSTFKSSKNNSIQTFNVSLSSKYLFKKVNLILKENSKNLYFFGILLFFVIFIYFSNKHGLFTLLGLLFSRKSFRKRSSKDEVYIPWSFKDDILKKLFKPSISLRDKIFVSSSSSELNKIKNISLDDLLVLITFSLKSLSFDNNFVLSKYTFSQLRLLRLYLAKIADFSKELQSNKYKLLTLLAKINYFMISFNNYLSVKKDIVGSDYKAAKKIIKDVKALKSDLETYFKKKTINDK